MLPTVEPSRAQPRSAAAPGAFTPLRPQAFTPSQQTPQPLQTEEILGNTVDPYWRFSAQTVPTRSSLTMPEGLPFGFVIQPFVAPEDSTRWLRRAAERCQGCGAFRNLYVAVEAATGRWMCNFCGHVQASDDLKGKEAIEACREMRDAVVEYVEPIPGAMRGAELGGGTYVFAIDTTIRQRDLAHMQAAVVNAVQNMHANDNVALVAFDGVVKVFDLSKEDCGSAHVLPGVSSPSQAELNTLGANGAQLTAPVHMCASTLVAIVKSLKPPVRQPSRAKGKLRCVGAAIETAVAIAAASAQKGSSTSFSSLNEFRAAGKERVLVLLGGPPTCGPGVVEAGDEEQDRGELAANEEEDEPTRYFGQVGLRSRLLGVAVDIFAVSALGVGVRRLQALTSACGGDTVVHPTFSEALLNSLAYSARHNFSKVLSLVTFYITYTRALNVEEFLSRGGGSEGRSRAVFDIKYSPQVDVTRIIGPLVPPASKDEQALSETLPNLAISPGIDARHAFAGVFQLREDLAQDFVYFQAATAHTSAAGERVVRVSTQRLAVTNNTALLIQSVDVDVAAVIMGKEAVMCVREGGVTAGEARDELSQRLQTIATTLGGQVKVTMQGRMATMPSQLAHLPHLIFHLQAGPLLGPILNDDDNSEAVRLLYLNSGVEDCRRLMCPALMATSLDGAFTFTQVPLQDVSLLPDRILLLDHHTHIFIWSGSQVAGKEFDETRKKLTEIVKTWSVTRFPAPEIMCFKEGDSMARHLVCRLDPASKDGQGRGLVSGLAGAVRGLLSSRFVNTDDPSMSQWLTRYRMAL